MDYVSDTHIKVWHVRLTVVVPQPARDDIHRDVVGHLAGVAAE